MRATGIGERGDKIRYMEVTAYYKTQQNGIKHKSLHVTWRKQTKRKNKTTIQPNSWLIL